MPTTASFSPPPGDRELELTGFQHLARGEYSEAIETFRAQWDSRIELQESAGVWIPKGGPAHNLGICFLYLGNDAEGLSWILRAFTEDVIQESEKRRCHHLPASRVLRGICGVPEARLLDVEDRVFELRSNAIMWMQRRLEIPAQNSIDGIVTQCSAYAAYSFNNDTKVTGLIASSRFRDAERICVEWYERLSRFQAQVGARIHKGHVLFNLGLSQVYLEKFSEALRNFRLAFIENVLSEATGEDATTSASYRNLVSVFDVEPAVLEDLAAAVRSAAAVQAILRPEELDQHISLAGSQRARPAAEYLVPKYGIETIPGTLDKRVFVGGGYALMPILKVIREEVEHLGFIPIMATDTVIPEGRYEEYCIRWVQNCRYAIFEMTLNGGHITELNEARNSKGNISVKEVYMCQDETRRLPRTAHGFLKEHKEAEGYVTIDELRTSVRRFLPT